MKSLINFKHIYNYLTVPGETHRKGKTIMEKEKINKEPKNITKSNGQGVVSSGLLYYGFKIETTDNGDISFYIRPEGNTVFIGIACLESTKELQKGIEINMAYDNFLLLCNAFVSIKNKESV